MNRWHPFSIFSQILYTIATIITTLHSRYSGLLPPERNFTFWPMPFYPHHHPPPILSISKNWILLGFPTGVQEHVTMALQAWLISVNVILSGSIHGTASISTLFLDSQMLFFYSIIPCNFSYELSTGGHLDWFHILVNALQATGGVHNCLGLILCLLVMYQWQKCCTMQSFCF